MAELGHFALALACALAIAQSILPLLGARLGEVRGAALMPRPRGMPVPEPHLQ